MERGMERAMAAVGFQLRRKRNIRPTARIPPTMILEVVLLAIRVIISDWSYMEWNSISSGRVLFILSSSFFTALATRTVLEPELLFMTRRTPGPL